MSQSDIWHLAWLSSDPGSAKMWPWLRTWEQIWASSCHNHQSQYQSHSKKCPTVMKATSCNPTQYASISIQVHSQLLTAIETGLLECDQVASPPIIHYITEDHWSNNNVIPGFQHSRRYSNMHSGRSRSTSYYGPGGNANCALGTPIFHDRGMGTSSYECIAITNHLHTQECEYNHPPNPSYTQGIINPQTHQI